MLFRLPGIASFARQQGSSFFRALPLTTTHYAQSARATTPTPALATSRLPPSAALLTASAATLSTSAKKMTETIRTKVCIVGSGPAAHTAAIYCARAELQPILFEGLLANNVAPGGQLTTTTDVENFPGFPEGVHGMELTQKFRDQSVRYGTTIYTETIDRIDMSERPFKLYTSKKEVIADVVIIATGAVAKRLEFPGAGEIDEGGFWQRGISACAVCDGAAPIFRNKPLFVIGGGDSAMEEAMFLTKFGSKVYIVHRRDELRASKIMQQRARENEKIEMLLSSEIIEAKGEDMLESVVVRNNKTGEAVDMPANGLFFAIGHTPASAFLDGQLETDEQGYIVTKPGTTETSVSGVFACGDVQDKRWRQAITAAGTGCMAALQAEHFLAENGLE